MTEPIYRVIEGEEAAEEVEVPEPEPRPVEVPLPSPTAGWRERPFFLSVLSLGLGGLGLLAAFYGLAVIVASLGPGLYLPGYGWLVMPGGTKLTTEVLASMCILIGVGIAAYIAGYGLWHFRYWAFALAIALSALTFVFGIGLVILQAGFLEDVVMAYGLTAEEMDVLYSTAMVTAVLAIGPAGFIIAYLLHIRHFFE